MNSAASTVGVQTPLNWSFWDETGAFGFQRATRELGFLTRSALMRAIRVEDEDELTATFCVRSATRASAMRPALDAMPFAATEDAELSFFSVDGTRRLRSGDPLRIDASNGHVEMLS